VALINVEPLDAAILEQTEFGPDQKRWLSNLVDIVNAGFVTIENALNSLIAIGQKDIGGGGAGPISVTVTGLLSSNIVNVQLLSSSNPVTIISVVPGSGAFTVTFSADPGASAVIYYQAFAK